MSIKVTLKLGLFSTLFIYHPFIITRNLNCEVIRQGIQTEQLLLFPSKPIQWTWGKSKYNIFLGPLAQTV